MSTEHANLTEELVEKGKRYFTPNYRPREEMVLDRGRGARVWDIEGKEYIDLGTGIAVSGLGHQDPALVAAISEQTSKLLHMSNIYFTEPSIRLAEEVIENSFAERIFFCNSGAEANEAAIKLARKHASLSGAEGKHEIITFEGSFHGRTLTTVTATAQPSYQEGFGPLPGGFTYCPFNDFDAIGKMVSDSTCAILVEPVQGEGGIHPTAPGFLAHLRALCDKHDALLILDEVQSGMGRTGKPFAYEWDEGVTPDVVTVAKSFGGGLPIGAMLVGAKAADTLAFGTHGSTFGGNPVAAAAARVVWQKLGDPQLLASVVRKGEKITARLDKLNDELGVFSEVRGRGLMIGAQLSEESGLQAGDLLAHCQHHGVLVLVAGGNTLRLLPPLTITEEELDEGLARCEKALRDAVAEAGSKG